MFVGQTERKIKIRINEHKSNIGTKQVKSTVAGHFIEEGHNISELKFCILEIIERHEDRDNHTQLLQRENYWICHLNSSKPHGMNERMEFLCYL